MSNAQLNFWRSRVKLVEKNGKPFLIKDVNIVPIIRASQKAGEEIFYRGESEDYENTALMPSAFRGCDEKAEYYDAITNFPREFDGLSNLSKLAKMQHYNYHTRLLDLTENPLVALWFACSDYSRNGKKTKKVKDGCFYVIATSKNNILSCDSDRALLLSCLSRLSEDVEKPQLLELLQTAFNDKSCAETIENRISEKWIKELKETELRDHARVFEKYIGEVNRERAAFAHYYTKVEDLLSTFIVRPKIDNERQRKQEGLFAIFGMQDTIYSNCNDYRIIKYVIPKSKKPNIIEQLDLLGFNEATLFGDMESRAHYFQTRNNK